MLSIVSHHCSRKADHAWRRSPLMLYNCLHRKPNHHPFTNTHPNRGIRIRRGNASSNSSEQQQLAQAQQQQAQAQQQLAQARQQAQAQQSRQSTPVSGASRTSNSTTTLGKSPILEKELIAATKLREISHRDWFFRRSNLSLLLFRLVAAGGLLHMVSEYGVEIIICEGPSMNPTIHPQGDIILVDKLTPRLFGIQGGTTAEERTNFARNCQKEHDRKLDRGTWYEPRIPVDQIPPRGAWKRFFARLRSGVSVGDVVVMKHIHKDGTICKRILGLPGDAVNSPPLEVRRSPIWRSLCQGNTLLLIPDGHIWLEGDNSPRSVDSRNYGPVPANLLVGRVVARIWPLRGRALMERGAPPSAVKRLVATTVLPAGYLGQEIIKDLSNLPRT